MSRSRHFMDCSIACNIVQGHTEMKGCILYEQAQLQERTPMTDTDETSALHRVVHTATLRDGSQLMVESWVDDNGVTQRMYASTRDAPNRSITWGPPTELLLD